MIATLDLILLVLMNIVSDSVFVLIIGPVIIARLTSSKAAQQTSQRIKTEVTNDDNFIDTVMNKTLPRVKKSFIDDELFMTELLDQVLPAVKGSILNDPEFMVTFQNDFISDEFINAFMDRVINSPSTIEGLEKFRETVMGQVLGFRNAEEHGMAVKALQKDFMTDLSEANPELSMLLDAVPSVKARVMKNPSLLPYAIKTVKKVLEIVQS